MLRLGFTTCILWAFLFGCGINSQEKSEPKNWAENFFQYYADRSNWEDFLDLYGNEVYFQDVIFRMELRGKEAFKNFYNWPDTGFVKHPDYPQSLVLEDLAVTDSTAVGRGHFTPFYYNGVLYDNWKNMRFTIWLHFNKEGKITRQIDYIEYPPSFLKSAAERLMQEELSVRE